MSSDRLEIAFKQSASERLERLERLVLQLEGGYAEDLARDGQRDLHTLKGDARVVGYERCQRYAHDLEELWHLAHGKRFSDPADLEVLLKCIDTLRAAVHGISSGVEPEIDSEALTSYLQVATRASPLDQQSGQQNNQQALDASATPAREEDSYRLASDALEHLTRIYSELRADMRRRKVLFKELTEAVEAAAVEAPSMHARLNNLRMAEQRVQEEAAPWLQRFEEVVQSLRLRPLDELFGRYPRAVRDLANRLGRRARLVVSGGQARVDQRVLTRLDECLLHLLSNAMDHGVEPPEEREAFGKDPIATLSVVANTRGSRVIIRVSDDGRGIDVERLRQTAVRRRAMSAEAARVSSPEDLLQMMFLPGFSTRDEVTEVSGRGVGLDIVRRRMEEIGGRIIIEESTLGRGSRFVLDVPATVSIIRAVAVVSGGVAMAFPSDQVVAVVGLNEEQLFQTGSSRVFRYESELVPLVEPPVLAEATAVERPSFVLDRGLLVLVLRTNNRTVGLSVDGVIGEQQVLQRPVGAYLEESSLLQSIVVLEDGTLAVCLSLDTLATLSSRSHALSPAASARVYELLVVDDSELTRSVVVGMLREAGYTVREAADGEKAIAALRERRPDLLLTDLQMPRVDGFELMRKVRADPNLERLPIIAISTLNTAADRQQATRCGADSYLVKSDLRAEIVVGAVRRLITSAS